MTLVKEDIVNLMGDIQFDISMGDSIGLKMQRTLEILDKEDSGFENILREEKMADTVITQLIIFYNYMNYIENKNLMALENKLILGSSIDYTRKFINAYSQYTTFIK